MLVELGLVEQRLAAVLEVLMTERRSLMWPAAMGSPSERSRWLKAYAVHGLGGLADRSSRPSSCPHQMAAEVEARIVAMRREHPGWGPRTILVWLAREGVEPLPGRISVERCLVPSWSGGDGEVVLVGASG